MAEQTCGNCKHGQGWTMTKHTPPRINQRYGGECFFQIAMPKNYPACVAEQDRRPPYKRGIWASLSDCPCWEAKPCKS